MGAREDLLAAAHTLAGRNQMLFSPADLIREARASGSAYPDATLRTFIVGPMCLNSPDNHAVQYGDLVRVSRGRYRLSKPQDRVATTNPPLAGPSDVVKEAEQRLRPEDSRPWFWEGNVQSAIVRHLVEEDWNVTRAADTASRERGIDIIANRHGTDLLVEVKGYPSETYTSGARRGEKKATSQPLHARQSFSHALLAAFLMRSATEESRVAIAFPAFETYRSLAQRTVKALTLARIEIWLVHEDGAITSVTDE